MALINSPSRKLARRTAALARLPKVAAPLAKDTRPKKEPRGQAALDAERAQLVALTTQYGGGVSSGYKPAKKHKTAYGN
jgi:hypothetical protein